MKVLSPIIPYSYKNNETITRTNKFSAPAQDKDLLQLGFQEPKHDKTKSNSLIKTLIHGPATKLALGSCLAASGVVLKTIGIISIVGAPVLAPIGIGMVLAGVGLLGWGSVQLANERKTNKSSLPSNPAFSLTKHQSQTQKLFIAAKEGNLEEVKTLIKSGIDINKPYSEGAVPLHAAAFIMAPKKAIQGL